MRVSVFKNSEGPEIFLKSNMIQMDNVRGEVFLSVWAQPLRNVDFDNLCKIRVYDDRSFLNWLLQKPITFVDLFTPTLKGCTYRDTGIDSEMELTWTTFNWERGSK